MVAVFQKKVLKGPVGLRNGYQNVRNLSDDQVKIIDLLANIPSAKGGKQPAWQNMPPLCGADGSCPSPIVTAILDFQTYWKQQGRLQVADGVVDPTGTSLRVMNDLAGRSPNAPDDPPAPDPGPPLIIPRRGGSWQISNVTTASIGEVGQVGLAQLQICQPNGKKFTMNGQGAGFGVGLDPASYLEVLKKANNPIAKAALKEIVDMFKKGVGFNIGDYLQLFGVSLPNVTNGTIIPNPSNPLLGRPAGVSRYMLAGGARPPFTIFSVGGSFGGGGEAGVVMFGLGGLLLCNAIGVYGSYGATLKFGAGVGGIIYNCSSVTDDP